MNSLSKQCPHCFRTYPDITLNFCLDDGSVLSDSFNSPVPSKDLEMETRLRSERKQRSSEAEPDSWRYERTARTRSEHPISSSAKTSDRPFSRWTSSDFVREITFQITGSHTFHAQECLEILRDFLNRFIGNQDQVLRKSTWQNGKAHFYNRNDQFTYDFQRQAEPSAPEFLLRLLAFSTNGQQEIQTVVRRYALDDPSTLAKSNSPKNQVASPKSTTTNSGHEYIRAAVAKHPNLELVVHPGLNHRIKKQGHSGSMWIIPRHGGVSITANGPVAPQLYREMKRLLGRHHREDAKGYRYFQANELSDVEQIIAIWSKI